MKRLLGRILPVGLAIALLAYAVKDSSFTDIGRQFRQADYRLIGLVGLVTLVSYFLRGKRWQQSLRALGYQPTVFRTTVAMQTGMVSSMIVLGSGELTRCATLQRTDGVPISQGIGSVVAERIIDLFMLVVVLLLTVLLEFPRMRRYLADLTLSVPNSYLVAGVIAAVIGTVFVVRQALRNQVVREHRLTKKIVLIGQGFGQGFMSVRRLPQPGLFVLLTVLGQVLSWLGIYLLLLAVDATRSLPPTAALTILAVSSLGGLAVPTQGGIGTYHFLVSRALVLYGFTATEGAVTATFLHAIGFGINLLLSGLSFLLLPALIAAKQNRSAKAVAK